MTPSREENVSPDLTPEEIERLARYVSSQGSDDERRALEREILASGRMTEALYADLALGALLERAHDTGPVVEAPVSEKRPVDRGVTKGRANPKARWFWTVTPLAAAAALTLVFLLPRGEERGGPRFRGVGGADRVVLLAPIGTQIAPPLVFRWSRDPSATHYRVEVLDSAGQVRFSADTPDTSFPVPAETEPAAGGRWRVRVFEGDREVWCSLSSSYDLAPR